LTPYPPFHGLAGGPGLFGGAFVALAAHRIVNFYRR
jgi:hypothetical protein